MNPASTTEFNSSWVINGYLSVGKSSMLKTIRSQLATWMVLKQNADIDDVVKTYHSSMADWHVRGINLLSQMQEALTTNKPSPWVVRMQIAAITNYLSQDLLILRESGQHLCLQERDVDSILQVFLPFFKNRGLLTAADYNMLRGLAITTQGVNVELMKTKKQIFLYADKNLCFDRFCQKNRFSEKLMSRHDFNELCLALDFQKHMAQHEIDTSYLRPAEVAKRVSDILQMEYYPSRIFESEQK